MNKPQGEQAANRPAKQVYRELVTINGKNVVLAHDDPPVINAGVLENADTRRQVFADAMNRLAKQALRERTAVLQSRMGSLDETEKAELRGLLQAGAGLA